MILILKKLVWDSEFWGYDIYNLDNPDFYSIQKSKQLIKDNCLIQTLVSENEINIISLLKESGFEFIESKINFKKAIIKKVIIKEKFFKEAKKIDIDEYFNVFHSLYGQNSRFFIFSVNKINEFYYTWLTNSINGEMDDKCIGYYINEKLAGFVTYKINKDELKIGLLGVFNKYQNMGISQELLGYVNNIAWENRISNVSISTQGKNLKAINAYIKNGFLIESIKHWHYLKEGKII